MKGKNYNHKLPRMEVLKNHYFVDNMSARDIAKEYGVTKGAVLIKFQRYGVKRRTMPEAQELIANHVTLTKTMIAFINGLLLGDGCIITTPEGKSASYSHTDKHEEYLIWLKKEFKKFNIGCSKITQHQRTQHPKTLCYSIKTKNYRDFMYFRNIWYPEGKKKIPTMTLRPEVLFNWYIGDGSYDRKSKSHKVVICSQFDPKGKSYMCDLINAVGIKTSIYPQSIYIKKESRDLFFNYITNHNHSIPSCYKYKF